MRIKSNVYQCRFECTKCEDDGQSDVVPGEASEENTSKKRQRHCHCPLWKPSTELVESMIGGQPSRRYKQELKRKREEMESEKLVNNVGQEARDKSRKQLLKESLSRLQARLAKMKEVSKTKPPAVEVGDKEKKRKRKEEREKRIKDKRARITFLR